ncbi:MAG: tetratricopeptide repeat protein [Sphingobacteriaceae bacterium]|nr:tetratricopeptide repeat protein [Sphingobacteriaceae bacterium]
MKIIRSNQSHDTAIISAYYELAWEYIYSVPDSSYQFGLKAQKIAKDKNYPHFEAKVYNLLGAVAQVKGEYLKAIDHYQKAMVIGENAKDDNTLMVTYGNIGSLYINLGRTKLALDFQLKSLDLALKHNKIERLASIYNNLSLIYHEFKEHDKAVEYGLKSVEINTQHNLHYNLGSSYGNLGNAYYGKNDFEKALVNYNKCYELAVETQNNYELSKASLDLAEVHMSLKNYKKALSFFQASEKLAIENEITENLLGAYKGLHNTYLELKDTKNALKYLKLYVALNNTVNKAETEKEVSQKVMEFNYNMMSFKDSIKNAEEAKYKDILIQAGQAQIEKDRILKIALIIGLLFVVGFGLIIYNRFRITTKQKIIIETKNKQTEEQKIIIEAKQKEILDSINYAKRIQDALLENFEMVSKFFPDSFLLNLPKDIVSGDFYWINRKTFTQKTERGSEVTELFYLSVCDSTGHGVPGGFMSMLNISYLSEAVNEKEIYQPHKVFDYVRDKLITTISRNDQKDGFDGCLLCFEKVTQFENRLPVSNKLKLSYAAAFNAPILIKNKVLSRLEVDKMPVGDSMKTNSFTLYHMDIQAGDKIYLYTDGYPDQFGGPITDSENPQKINRNGKKFQYRQLDQLILENSDLSFSEQKNRLFDKFYAWKGEFDQIDDVCVIGIKI